MASISQTAGARPALSFTGRGGLVDKYFYLAMGLLTAATVYAGFSQTVNMNLFHPAVPRPNQRHAQTAFRKLVTKSFEHRLIS